LTLTIVQHSNVQINECVCVVVRACQYLQYQKAVALYKRTHTKKRERANLKGIYISLYFFFPHQVFVVVLAVMQYKKKNEGGDQYRNVGLREGELDKTLFQSQSQ